MRLSLLALFFLSGCGLFGPASVFDNKPEDTGNPDTEIPCTEQAWYPDTDSDGYGSSVSETWECDQPEGYVANGSDCDDKDPAVNPAAVEVCDGIDNNCDGEVDNDADGDDIWYVDADGDGYGNPDMAQDCNGHGWLVTQAGDCDDLDSDVNPAATELCDGIDNDCDDTIDEDDAADATPWYEDADSDLYGNNAVVRDACVQPEGYVADNTDCDDTDDAVFPGAPEFCDETDNDCDGEVDEDVTTTFYIDGDGDGYGNSMGAFEACLPAEGMVENNDDCNDDNAEVFPGAEEICNGIDDDCDGEVDELVKLTFYIDGDGDFYGNAATTTEACSAPSGFVLDATDCDDTRSDINPGETEQCDGSNVDEDCDGLINDEDPSTDPSGLFALYYDADEDGYGNASTLAYYCESPTDQWIGDSSDCDDTDATIFPGATELCNGLDDDCDGVTDEDDALDATTWYMDVDTDGYGDVSVMLVSCGQPAGYVEDGTDCDDLDRSVHPNATEFCDEIDNDCDGSVDEERGNLFYADVDGDGYGDPLTSSEACVAPLTYVDDDSDCDDTDAAINLGAAELCNGLDDDCDGITDEDDAQDALTWYLDADSDLYGNASAMLVSCGQPAGYVVDNTDCDDLNRTVNPGASELCNSVDDNCNSTVDEGVKTTFFADADGDGYGNAATTTEACSAPSGFVSDATDCDDENAGAFPGASEFCNSIDDDCDGVTDESDALDATTWYLDADSDLYGNASAMLVSCGQPAGYVVDNTDCDDLNRTVNPGASELCNGIDDDCDGTTDEGVKTTFFADADADGYGNVVTTTEACSAPFGYVANSTDCDDADATVHPAAFEVCDGLDNDCDGDVDGSDAIDALTWYLDADADDYGNATMTQEACEAPMGYVSDATDCNDLVSSVHPGASEWCNGTDDDCDGTVDEGVKTTFFADADGDGYGNAATTTEACSAPSGFVSDATDCDDTSADVFPNADEYCNGIDDDCDGITDEDDALDATTWYLDADSDLYGDAANSIVSCGEPAGYVENDADCDDADEFTNPDGIEICDDGADNDCDGNVDVSEDECLYEGLYTGTFTVDVALTAFGITDTCTGAVELDVAIDADPMIFGEASCSFAGVFATYYADDIIGTIEGDAFADMSVEGVLYDADEIFSSEWDGVMDGGNLDASFTGEGTLLGYVYTYTGVFETIYTSP
jgi:hypothetical protein